MSTSIESSPARRIPEIGARFVLRRSLPSLAALSGLLIAVSVVTVAVADVPLATIAVLAAGVVAIQYALDPWLIRALVPAQKIEHDGSRYLTDHVVGEILAHRCRDAGVPLVHLGIVDDGTPNAFTFGHCRRDTRVWVTRGLLERLDRDELDAVIAHELGHIRNHDFVIMTVAAAIPMMLYFVARTLLEMAADSDGDDDGSEGLIVVALAAYLCYGVSEFLVLSLSRAREYAADYWSCACTANGDALASALVKIAYGMNQVAAAERDQQKQHANAGTKRNAASRRERRAQYCLHSMRVMGIFEPRAADGMATAFANGVDLDRAVAAMRWEATNPWGAFLEKFGSHPLVARRIAALERSQLPGAPHRFGVIRSLAEPAPSELFEARVCFLRELVAAVAPWAVLSTVLLAVLMQSVCWIGAAIGVAGVLFLAKQQMRYPAGFESVDEIAGLLERLDASPVRGLPVEVCGQIIGRASPGYVLSPDLVVQDASGFVTLRYSQPIPFGAQLFGLFRVPDYLGRQVVTRGWYHRAPEPIIELRDVRAVDERRTAKCYWWVAKHAVAIALVIGGLITTAIGLTL